MKSRSLNSCWGFCLDSFRSLAFERDSGDGEFKEDHFTSLGLTNTMSGLADVTRMSGGMVEWGLSLARPGRSEYSFSQGSICLPRAKASLFKAQSLTVIGL